MAKQVIPENEILRAEQLRILRAAGVDQVDERIRHLLATGRLMRDLYPRRAGVLALALLGLALAVGCSDEEAAPPLDAGTVAAISTATATGTGTAATLPPDAGSTQTATGITTKLTSDAGAGETRSSNLDAKVWCAQCGNDFIQHCTANGDGTYACNCGLTCGTKPGDPWDPMRSCLAGETPGIWCPLTTSKPACACYIAGN